MPATLIGASARTMMMTGWAGGQVEAVFSQAAYILGIHGEVVWLSLPGNQPHWRSVIVPFEAKAVHKGAEVALVAGHLRIGEDLAIQIAEVPVWEPPTLTPEEAAPPTAIYEAALRMTKIAAAAAPSEGLGQMIAVLAANSGKGGRPPLESRTSLALASGSVLTATGYLWNTDRAFNDTLYAARSLIGLGPGLTPSGDDFVGGLLFAARSMESVFPGLSLLRQADVIALLALAREQTNGISYALLTDYAQGRGPEALHDLARLLITEQDESSTMAAMKDLVRIGHTSGWDILAGFCTGILMVNRIENRPQTLVT